MTTSRRPIVLVVTLVAVLAATVLAAGEIQRRSLASSLDQHHAADEMVHSQLDQENGLRGFLLYGESKFLDPYRDGSREFDSALAESLSAADGDPELLIGIERLASLSSRWQRSADDAIDAQRAGESIDVARGRERTRIMEKFREVAAELEAVVDERQESSTGRAEAILLSLIIGVGVLFTVVGYVTIVRPARERALSTGEADEYREAREEFVSTLQATDEQAGAQRLVKRHIERDIAECGVVVLNRNNSENRLEAATEIPTGTGLEERLADATPRSCLAVRLGQEHHEEAGSEPLLSCELCGKEAAATCIPSVVGGEVIGSVLVTSREPLAPVARERVADAVTQASPVLANLRNLSVAEVRAATDALTGLANKRSCQETLKRMVAQSARSASSLAAFAIDLDHFKHINDRFGHGAGDDVLASVGAILRERLRASDFAGRPGGEEFLVLLPDTQEPGAMKVAEELREAIGAIRVPSVEGPISASIGVAVHPDHAGDAETLVRTADRALYAAKTAGRNRVELASAKPSAPTPAESVLGLA